MELCPSRKEDESFEQYKMRRAGENAHVRYYIENPPRSDMKWRTFRFGPLGIKRLSMTAKSMAKKARHA